MASLTDPMKAYVCANLLLIVAAALLHVIRAVSPRLRRPIAYRHQLRLGQALALAVVLLAARQRVFGSREPSAADRSGLVGADDGGRCACPRSKRIGSRFLSGPPAHRYRSMSWVEWLLSCFAAGLLVVLARLAKDASLTAADHRGRARDTAFWVLDDSGIRSAYACRSHSGCRRATTLSCPRRCAPL
jgi:hypothetical protein